MTKNNNKINERKTPAAPGPIYVTNGSFKGEVYLQWDAVSEANNYVVEVSKTTGDKSSTWQQIDIISDPHYMMQGLKSGKSYSFRISAIYPDGRNLRSEPVTKKIK